MALRNHHQDWQDRAFGNAEESSTGIDQTILIEQVIHERNKREHRRASAKAIIAVQCSV
jgi:hypothetical protein